MGCCGLCNKVRPREVGDTYELNMRSDPSLKIVNSKLLFLKIDIFDNIEKKYRVPFMITYYLK